VTNGRRSAQTNQAEPDRKHVSTPARPTAAADKSPPVTASR
jgi:hypothetical protein